MSDSILDSSPKETWQDLESEKKMGVIPVLPVTGVWAWASHLFFLRPKSYLQNKEDNNTYFIEL